VNLKNKDSEIMATAELPLALVTGASSGIGLELAKVLAAEGHDLIITSDNRGKLETAARIISSATPDARIEIIAADLARADGAETLYRGVQQLGRPIDVLVNNAGIGVWGEFAKGTDLSAELAMIQINVCSVITLTKLFSREMVARRKGRILITASEAAIAPTALASVYGATKAFDYTFALALREELKDTGVTVTALLPGPTDTNWFNRANAAHTSVAQGNLADPAQVARDGYDALMKGDDHVVTPLKDKMLAVAAKLAPDRMSVQRLQ
jgi:short-subunit dehydrogenase